MAICKICKHKLQIKYQNMFDDRHGLPGRFEILECLNCGFMQTNPQISLKDLTNIYTNYYPKRDANIEEIVLNSKKIPDNKTIKQKGLQTDCHFQTKKGQKVLDIGCGTCQSLLEINKLGGTAWGIDPDKNSQRVAKKLKLKFQLGTIHNAELPSKYFDLITASQVLEHEKDPIEFLKTCKKYLKNNGKIVMSFPNTNSLYKKVWGKKWLHWHVPYHLNHFNKKSVEILAKKTGLRIKNIKTVTPNIWTILQLKSVFTGSKEGEPNFMWGTPSKYLKKTRQTKLKENPVLKNLIPLIEKTLFINRLLDKLGYGESFVVTLVTYQ